MANNNKLFWQFSLGSLKYSTLQLGITLNNEAGMLENVIQIFSMVGRILDWYVLESGPEMVDSAG